jgi:DNA-binding response OmpR family regulator
MGCPNGAATSGSLAIRLLLIEDNAVLAEATADFLRSAGLDVRLSESGEAGLKVAVAFQPQIVLCDFRLPDMSGLEVVRALRRNPSTKNVLVALHSALDEEDVMAIEENEVNLFLPKPMTAERLEELLTVFRGFQAA